MSESVRRVLFGVNPPTIPRQGLIHAVLPHSREVLYVALANFHPVHFQLVPVYVLHVKSPLFLEIHGAVD